MKLNYRNQNVRTYIESSRLAFSCIKFLVISTETNAILAKFDSRNQARKQRSKVCKKYGIPVTQTKIIAA